MELEVRYEALNWASQQFASNYVSLGQIGAAVERACILAAPATGDANAEAGVVSFCDRATAALNDACSRLIDVAGTLRRAVETYRSADSHSTASETQPPGRLGGPQ